MNKKILIYLLLVFTIFTVGMLDVKSYAGSLYNLSELEEDPDRHKDLGYDSILNDTGVTAYLAIGKEWSYRLYFTLEEQEHSDGYSYYTLEPNETFNGSSFGGGGYGKYVSKNELFGMKAPTPKAAPVLSPQPESKVEPAPAPHIHSFVTGTIYEATCNSDGLEGTYCSTCGFIKESSPISAFGYTLDTYAQQKMDVAKSGQNIVLEFGELSSFPKSFMEKIAQKVAAGVSFEFRYKVNHKLQKIKIPAYSTVDTSLDWYGHDKMAELYGMN